MWNTKTGSSWQETKAKIRRYYLRSGSRDSRLVDISNLENPYELPNPPRWSASDIKSFIRATKLCKECYGIFDHLTFPISTRIYGCYYHHDSYNGLLRCANSGCRVCVVLVGKAQTWLSAGTNGDRYGNQQLCSWWRHVSLGSIRKEVDFLIGPSTCALESELQSLWTLTEYDCRMGPLLFTTTRHLESDFMSSWLTYLSS